MRRLFGSDKSRNEAEADPGIVSEEAANEPLEAETNHLAGAVDTLSNVVRTFGDESFPLDSEIDPNLFRRECSEFVRHIENGEAVTSREIPRSLRGEREWSQIRNFFGERRRAERKFVTERIGDYRELVEELIGGLRRIGERDHDTQERVQLSLSAMEKAVESGELGRIEEAFKSTIEQVSDTFEEQRLAYERQLGELNDRMAALRQDLVAAREEMKRDSLTDAYNRGAFDTAIEQSLNMHFVLQQPVTLVMIDCDKFKEINDEHGHATGDQALRAVGECLARAFIRKSDLVARFGGDEFAVILNETSAEAASRVIERFVKSVEKIRLEAGDELVGLTCSVGYTELTDKDTTESVIRRADEGLYAVKSRGGNGAEFRPAKTDETVGES